MTDTRALRLVVQQAFIEELQSQVITLKEGGIIQSESMTNGERDFLIKASGEAAFNKATIRGHIEANSGTLNNIMIEANALFTGSIISGPLQLLNSSPQSELIVYATGVNAEIIIRTEFRNLQINIERNTVSTKYFDVVGTYGNKNICRIAYKTDDISVGNHPRTYFMLYVTYEDGTTQLIAEEDWGMSFTLSFKYSVGGKTFLLKDLPTSDPGLPGAVWREGKDLRIS